MRGIQDWRDPREIAAKAYESSHDGPTIDSYTATEELTVAGSLHALPTSPTENSSTHQTARYTTEQRYEIVEKPLEADPLTDDVDQKDSVHILTKEVAASTAS